MGFQQFEKANLDSRELIAYYPEIQPKGFSYSPSTLRLKGSLFRENDLESRNDELGFENCDLVTVVSSTRRNKETGRMLYQCLEEYLWKAREEMANDHMVPDVDDTLLNILFVFIMNNLDKDEAMRKTIIPKNVLMIGPTG